MIAFKADHPVTIGPPHDALRVALTLSGERLAVQTGEGLQAGLIHTSQFALVQNQTSGQQIATVGHSRDLGIFGEAQIRQAAELIVVLTGHGHGAYIGKMADRGHAWISVIQANGDRLNLDRSIDRALRFSLRAASVKQQADRKTEERPKDHALTTAPRTAFKVVFAEPLSAGGP